MKRLLTTVGALALTATGAFAQTTATQDVNITASVPKFCTIGGVATPAALTASIPVSAIGAVDTTDIVHNVTTVVCNVAADLLATSQSGGVKTATTAPTGFTNIINYTGKAEWGGATSTINTATVATAAAAEAGNTASTTEPAAGTLKITITPQASSSPLVAATNYADTLRVTLTPK